MLPEGSTWISAVNFNNRKAEDFLLDSLNESFEYKFYIGQLVSNDPTRVVYIEEDYLDDEDRNDISKYIQGFVDGFSRGWGY